MMNGVLPLIKPRGMTSHDVVAKVRNLVRIRRIGHTGTLDPDVTGVLPLCVGQATRIVEYLQEQPKIYEAVMYLGKSTTTEDASGEIVDQVEHVEIDDEKIRSVLVQFIGPILQTPPMYSAVKHEGKRLYELAREGQTVQRQPREVLIHHIELQWIKRQDGHVLVSFEVRCSKGTYIRTLCVDIGKALGYPAMMDSLIRTGSGNLTLNDCYTLEQLKEAVRSKDWSHMIIPIDKALEHFPQTTLMDRQWDVKAQNGMKLPSFTADWPDTDSPVRLYASDRTFIGIYKAQPEQAQWTPLKLFHRERK